MQIDRIGANVPPLPVPLVALALEEAGGTLPRQALVERVGALAAMFERHGYGPEEAETRARVLYWMQVGYYALDLREPLEGRLARVPGYLLALTGREPLPGEVEANVLIHNISAAGLLIETDLPLDEKERLVLDLPEAGAARRRSSASAIGAAEPRVVGSSR